MTNIISFWLLPYSTGIAKEAGEWVKYRENEPKKAQKR